MQKKLLTITILLGAILTMNGQVGTRISLDSLYKKVEQRNYQIRLSEMERRSAQADFTKSHANFLPSVTLSYSGISTNNPLMAFGSKLNQEILTNGDFNPDLLNDPKAIQNYTAKVEIMQPLFNADGLSQRKAMKSAVDALEMQYQRTIQHMRLSVTEAYMQLQLAFTQKQVLEKAELTAREHLKVAQRFYDQGILQKSELLRVDIHLGSIRNKQIQTQTMIQSLSDMLNFLMGEPSGELLIPEYDLELNKGLADFTTELSDNRYDIKAMENGRKAAAHMYKATKNGFLPRLNAFAAYEMHDETLGKTGANGYLIGAQMTWNVFDGFKRLGAIQKQKIDLEKSALNLEQYKMKAQMELSNTTAKLEEKRQSVQLNQLAVQQAEEALRITRNRYEQGLEKTADLLTDEAVLLEKELALKQAFFEYNLTYAQLEFLTQ
jgi:outer membrane protein TolC